MSSFYDLAVSRIDGADDLLGALRIRPEIRVGGLLFDFG